MAWRIIENQEKPLSGQWRIVNQEPEKQPQEPPLSLQNAVWEGITNTPGNILNLLKDLPSEIWGAGKQLFGDVGNKLVPNSYLSILNGQKQGQSEDDWIKGYTGQEGENSQRSRENILSGLLKGGEKAANIPGNTVDWLSRSGYIPEKYQDSIPKLERQDYAKTIFNQKGEKPGDKLMQSLLDQVLHMGIAGIPGGAALNAIGGNENPIEAALTAEAIPAAARTYRSGRNAVNSLRSPVIAETILNDANRLGEHFNREYTDFFHDARTSGAREASINDAANIDRHRIFRNLLPEQRLVVEEYFDRPTLNNAHWAQSELGKEISTLEKSHAFKPLSHGKLRALREMRNARTEIKNSIHDALRETGNPELSARYRELGENYNREMRPYQIAPIQEYGHGKFGRERGLTPKDFIDKLKNNSDFNLTLAERYPQISRQSLAKKVAIGAGGAIGAGTLGGMGAKFGKYLTERSLD